MSSFKAYGKVDESEHALFEVRRKFRKRITIISLSTIVLVGIVFAAVFGTIAHNNAHNNNDNNTNNDQSLSSSVKAICDITLYKDSCESSLSPLVQSGQQIRPEDLFKLSIQVALNAVSKGVQYFSEHGTFDDLNLNVDNRTKEALMNCKDLLDLTIDHLNSSLSYGGKSSLIDVLEDLETWLSASGKIYKH
jgi:pectinesterase